MPEEINRVLSDHASEVLFAPTRGAVENLLKEGIPEENIHFVGDVMYDAALIFGKKAECSSKILEHLNIESKNYILATIHRAENTDTSLRLQAIFNGLIDVSKKNISSNSYSPTHKESTRTSKAAFKSGEYFENNSPCRLS